MTTNFGRDTSCTTGLRTGRFATGARLVGEAAFRRLSTPRGSLRGGEEEANYGFDLTEKVGASMGRGVVAALPGEIKNELTKDPRISAVTAVVTATTDSAGAISLDVVIEAETSEGPFTLQINVSELTVELVGLKAEG